MKNKGIHFNISERKVLLRILDITFVLTALFVLNTFFKFDYFVLTTENWSWILVLVFYIMVFGTIFELYDLQKASKYDVVLTNAILTASLTVLCYLLTPILTPFLPNNRLQILFFYIAIVIGLLLCRLLYVTLFASPRFFKRALIIGEISNIESVSKAFKDSDPNYRVVGFVNCEEKQEDSIRFKDLKEFEAEDIFNVVEKENISEVVIASYNSENITAEIYQKLIVLLESGIPIKEYTHVYENMTARLPVQFVGKDFYKYFPFSRNNQNKLYLTYRRTFDVFFAIIGIIVGVMITPFVFLGNLIANRGPLFYTQDRVGKNGKLFKIIKFRTMIQNAETNGAVWAQKNDSRITYFGNLLRLTRIDEFPQFINILKGEMSLIGPRPERPKFVKELSEVIPFYETRHIVKPGLTGWAQVKVRYGASVEDSLLKLQYDLYYIKHRSFFLDIRVIVKTLSTMIYFRGR